MSKTYTARITSNRPSDSETLVEFSNRQNAIDYVWPFCSTRKRRIGVGKAPSHYTYEVSIIVDMGTPFERILYPPNF